MSTQLQPRVIPDLPWSRLGATAALLTTLAAGGWELACRDRGYAPGLDDTNDLWVEAARTVRADSTVIVGASRGLFGLDLDVLEAGLGARPVQLGLVGSNPLPVLEHLAADASFRGTVILDLVPGLLLVPSDSPPFQNAAKAVSHLREQTWSQWISHLLSMPLERSFAALQQEDLTLAALLAKVPVPDRAGTQVPPAMPPYFYTTGADRRARMIDAVETETALREHIQHVWLPLFSPPPPPRWIEAPEFGRRIGEMIEGRFAQLKEAVQRLTDRGAKVVFVRMPSTGELLALENRLTPRAGVWDRVLRETGAPGVHFEDHPELAGFDCPEWSHLTVADATEFTARLVPHLRRALAAVE